MQYYELHRLMNITFEIKSFLVLKKKKSVLFTLQGEKRQIYEENIRVPLIVRGPGVKSNAMTTSVALNIDLVSGKHTYINFRHTRVTRAFHAHARTFTYIK